MAKQQYEPIHFGGLANTYVEGRIPLGRSYTMLNASFGRGNVQARPGFSEEYWARSGSSDGDVAWGSFYGSYGNFKEYFIVVQRFIDDGPIESEATLFVFDENGLLKMTQQHLHASEWFFEQYNDRIYGANLEGGMWMHTIGQYTLNSDDDTKFKWREFQPEFRIGKDLSLTVSRPPYDQRSFLSTDTVHWQKTDPSAPDWYTGGSISPPDLKLYEDFDPTYEPEGNTAAIVTFVDPVDWSNVDFVYFEVRSLFGHALKPDSVPRTWQFKVSEEGVSDLGTEVDGNSVEAIAFLASMKGAKAIDVYGTEGQTLYARVDISNIVNDDKDAILRVAIAVPAKWGDGGLDIRVSSITLGGANMWDLEGASPEIDYGFCYYDPDTKTLLPGVVQTVPAATIEGTKPGASEKPLGAWVSLNPEVSETEYDLGYTKVRVFRKATDAPGFDRSPTPSGSRWVLIATLENKLYDGDDPVEWVDVVDPSLYTNPNWIDYLAESAIQELPEVEIPIGNIPVDLKPSGIGFWKQHFLLALDRKIFFSWAGLPNLFLPPPDDDFNPPEEDDLTQGRTLFVSGDRSEEVFGVATQDNLYIVGRESVYVMIGDSAKDATPPRKLPSARGASGPRGFCAHDGGVLVCGDDGLWYYEASRAFTGSEDGTYVKQEMTREVRQSWLDLRGSDASNIIVASIYDEIWVLNGVNYMRLGRPDPETDLRQWEAGTIGPQSEEYESTVQVPDDFPEDFRFYAIQALNQTRTGQTVTISNADNARRPDASYAEVSMAGGDKTGTLQILSITPRQLASLNLQDGFSFPITSLIPVDAALTSASVRIWAWTSSPSGTAPLIYPDSVQVLLDGAPVGGNQVTSAQHLSTSANTHVDFPIDLVALGIATGDFNRTGLTDWSRVSVELGFTAEAATGNCTLNIDCVEIVLDTNIDTNDPPFPYGLKGDSFDVGIGDTVVDSLGLSPVEDHLDSIGHRYHCRSITDLDVTPYYQAGLDFFEVESNTIYQDSGGVGDHTNGMVVTMADDRSAMTIDMSAMDGTQLDYISASAMGAGQMQFLYVDFDAAGGTTAYYSERFDIVAGTEATVTVPVQKMPMQSVIYHPVIGVRSLFGNGRSFRMFRDAVDAPYLTDGGAAIPWSVSTGWLVFTRRRVVSIYVTGSGTPTILLTMDDGVAGEHTFQIQRQALRRWMFNVNALPGFQFKVTASGASSGDTVEDLYVVTEPLEQGHGN